MLDRLEAQSVTPDPAALWLDTLAALREACGANVTTTQTEQFPQAADELANLGLENLRHAARLTELRQRYEEAARAKPKTYPPRPNGDSEARARYQEWLAAGGVPERG